MDDPGTPSALKLTLDTSCVIHAVAGQRYAEDVEELACLGGRGWAELWLGMLIDDRTADAGRAIQEILRIGVLDTSNNQSRTRWRKRIRDVQHLTSHFFHGHDAFVTSDEDDMLKKRDELLRRTGIVIDTPAEAVLRVRKSREQAHNEVGPGGPRPWLPDGG